MKQRFVTVLAVLTLAGAVALVAPARAESSACSASDVLCFQPAAQKLIDTITTVTEPTLAVPDWLN